MELTFLQNGKVIATVPAHTIPLQDKAPYNSALSTKNDDGRQSLVEIEFSNKKYGLSLRNSPDTQISKACSISLVRREQEVKQPNEGNAI